MSLSNAAKTKTLNSPMSFGHFKLAISHPPPQHFERSELDANRHREYHCSVIESKTPGTLRVQIIPI